MGKLRLAVAALLIFLPLETFAGVRTIKAGNESGLIKAFEDANADTSEMVVVIVEGAGTFEFTDDYQNSGFALPPLEGARVSILVEKPGVTFFFNPPPAANSKSETTPMGGVKLEGGAKMFVGALFLDTNAYLAGRFPVPGSVEDLPTFDHGPNADGPLFESVDSILIFNMIRLLANLQAAILATNSRFLGFSSYIGSEELNIEAPSGASPPSNSEVDSIVPELVGFVTIAKSSSGPKAVDVGALEAFGARVSELARQGDNALADSVLTGPRRMVNMSGTGTLHVENTLLENTSILSPVIEVNGVLGATKLSIRNSVISHPDYGQAIRLRRADGELDGVTIAAEDALRIQDEASVKAYRSILGTPGANDSDPACEFAGFGASLISMGYNISPDSSCGLDKSTDHQNTNPRLTAPAEGDFLPALANNSPAIDRGPSGLVGGNLPCGTTDLTGTARPQDGNGDGKAECDVGAIEKASRGSIDRRQSGAYFDSKRNGEGIFVEMLGPDTALVYLFSYRPNGDPFWALGVGRVVGNGIVIRRQDFMTTRGGVFGPGFDPDDVEFMPFADVAINFPDCRNTARKGSMAIEPNGSMGFGAVLADLERLSFILDCSSREALGPGYSGSYFDPSHDGEGIILQVINATTVVVQWFTYDGQGNQYWIQGIGTLNGDTITVDEAFAYSGPRYGPSYDPGDLVPVTWGSITIEFNGCDAATFTYDSALAGFGQGTQEMQRLTTLLGVDCS